MQETSSTAPSDEQKGAEPTIEHPETHMPKAASSETSKPNATAPKTAVPETTLAKTTLQKATAPKTNASEDNPEKPIILRAPRSPIWDWFLTFSTFGFYSNFWFYARVKEINLISKTKFTPWLWWLMPFFALCQIFAFVKFDKALGSLEDPETTKKSRTRYSIGCVGAVLATMYFSASAKWVTPSWLELVFMLVFTFSFTLLTVRINNIKRHLKDVEFKGKENGYSLFEWVIVIVMFPLVFGLFSYHSIAPFLVDKLETFPHQFEYTQEDKSFALTFHGVGWYRVEAGTFSDGTSLAEFSNSIPDSYFLLFNNNEIDDVNEHIHFRRNWIKETFSNTKCTEERRFVPRSMHLKIELQCNGTMALDPSIALVTFIQTPNHNYELLGVLSAPKGTYRQWLSDYQSMAWEFTTK